MNDVLSYELERTVKDIHIFLSKLSGKTILITGATGFIGSMLTRLFLVSNMKYGTDINIICSVRNIEKAEALFSNLKNSEQLVYITNGLVACNDSVDYIFHTAAPTTSKFFVTQPVETLNGSISTTLDVLQYATKNKVKKIVYLSSMEQYGIQQVDYQNMTEDDLGYIHHLDVRSSYSEGKRICECYCSAYFHEYNVPVCIARVAQCFGPGLSLLDNRVSMQFAKSVIHNKNIILHKIEGAVTKQPLSYILISFYLSIFCSSSPIRFTIPVTNAFPIKNIRIRSETSTTSPFALRL